MQAVNKLLNKKYKIKMEHQDIHQIIKGKVGN